jgi:ketosteroid isomerase-like protein
MIKIKKIKHPQKVTSIRGLPLKFSFNFRPNPYRMNKEIVQKIYSALRTKDTQFILQLLSEDAHWSVSATTDKIPWAETGRGHEAVVEYIRIMNEWLSPEAYVIQDLFENGNKIIAFGFNAGYIKPTGDHYEFDFVHLWELKNGKVTKFRAYYDTAYLANAISGEPKTSV